MADIFWKNAIIMFVVITGVQCLRNVTLEIIPEIVERGHEVILRCHYILDKPHLYSLKWYRGKHEFYRYVPKEEPSTKIFNVPGIEVDTLNSNESQVTIKNVDFGLTGNISCEVTADAPTFSTETATKKIVVMSLPARKPTIKAERRRYNPGDLLRANCSVPPSKPPVEFSFQLNNELIKPVESSVLNEKTQLFSEKHGVQDPEAEWQWSEIRVTLQPHHYTNSQLNLRCITQIPGMFKATTDIQLNAWEPVPERVTSDSGAAVYGLGLLTLLCLSTVPSFIR
ncbi:uncharacterized protein [Chelonus insularis]|uniref:uncharacterized protein n=1 Tax=Chelonus insularis TaxID=460826 RepID=UPI00158F5BE5|nr:uncharacterized protein LOC118067287 [Chelonus insularis]